MSALNEALALTRSGLGPEAVARRLHLRPDAVAVLLDHAERLGLAERAAPGGCTACAVPARSGCAGCPLGRAASRS